MNNKQKNLKIIDKRIMKKELSKKSYKQNDKELEFLFYLIS